MPSLDSLLTLLVGLTFGCGLGFVLCFVLTMNQIDTLRRAYIDAMKAQGLSTDLIDLPWPQRLFPRRPG